MIKEIATLISSLTGFTIGTDLQVGHWEQEKPKRCVLIQESGGQTDFYQPDRLDMQIQVLCRAEKYHDARADSYTVYDALHGTSNWNMPRLDGASGEDYLAMTVEALYAPQYLGRDDNRRHLFSTNYIFRCEEGSCDEPSGSGS